MKLKMFTVNCMWLGLDGETVRAVSGEAARLSVLIRHGIVDAWCEEHYPADDDDDVDMWSVCFGGQNWSNGDFNTETLSVYEAEPEDVAAPC